MHASAEIDDRLLARKRSLFTGKARFISPNETLLLMDLSRTRPCHMIDKICKRLRINAKTILFIWASPPCNTYSKVGPINVKRGCHYRDHDDPAWPPRIDGSSYGKIASEHDKMNSNLTKSLVKVRNEHGVHFAIENPRGGLRRRPFMNTVELKTAASQITVDYCAFQHPYKKQTDIWTSAKEWIPAGITGDGKCHGQCKNGEIDTSTGLFKHYKTIAGCVTKGPTGKRRKMQKAIVPDLLLNELLGKICENNLDNKRRLVIDLFAGNGSLRHATKNQGLEYLAVDIIDFM
jgi:hypothetical protein